MLEPIPSLRLGGVGKINPVEGVIENSEFVDCADDACGTTNARMSAPAAQARCMLNALLMSGVFDPNRGDFKPIKPKFVTPLRPC